MILNINDAIQLHINKYAAPTNNDTSPKDRKVSKYVIDKYLNVV